MRHRATHWLLALLLSLCIPRGALAQEEEERVDITPRIQEIRALFAKLQEASKDPASIDRKSKAAPAQWYRLQAWDMTVKPDVTLRKLVVTSRDKSGELERAFYLKGDLLFFAHYVRTTPGSARERKKDEERLYFDDTGVPIRWQHNKDIRPLDGHAYRWGEQARSDAKVAQALAADKASTARFEPITCVVGSTTCRTDMGGNYCVTENSLFPPPGLPVQEDLCSDQPWFAGQNVTCSFNQEGRVLTVTESFQQSCPADDETCASEGSKSKEIPLSPEMGRVEECPVFGK